MDKTFKPKKLEWSKIFAPNEEIRYTHVISETPFGRFLITWKSWKDDPSYDVDETPWGEGIYTSGQSLELAKERCETEWNELLKECYE